MSDRSRDRTRVRVRVSLDGLAFSIAHGQALIGTLGRFQAIPGAHAGGADGASTRGSGVLHRGGGVAAALARARVRARVERATFGASGTFISTESG